MSISFFDILRVIIEGLDGNSVNDVIQSIRNQVARSPTIAQVAIENRHRGNKGDLILFREPHLRLLPNLNKYQQQAIILKEILFNEQLCRHVNEHGEVYFQLLYDGKVIALSRMYLEKIYKHTCPGDDIETIRFSRSMRTMKAGLHGEPALHVLLKGVYDISATGNSGTQYYSQEEIQAVLKSRSHSHFFVNPQILEVEGMEEFLVEYILEPNEEKNILSSMFCSSELVCWQRPGGMVHIPHRLDNTLNPVTVLVTGFSLYTAEPPVTPCYNLPVLCTRHFY